MMNRKELYLYIQEKQPNICQISVLQNGNEVYSADRTTLSPKRRLGREPDRVLKMDRGNARPESGGRRRLPGDVLRLSLVDRAPGEKHLCCRRKQRQCNLCGSEQEDCRCGFFVFQAYCI